MSDFVHRGSIVRRIWGNPDLILLIFAGSAAEFALNRAVDWLFFTGKIPRDPIGRLFSTVRYAQEIVFVDEDTARRTLSRINASHHAVEQKRKAQIPAWAYRDVLYMLVDYSERAHRFLYRPLSKAEQNELYNVFVRIGQALLIPDLAESYEEWRVDRRRHLILDLSCSEHTKLLYRQYRRHLGGWRYYLLLQVQALLVPEEVRRLLHLRSNGVISSLMQTYGVITKLDLQSIVHGLLIPPQYWSELREFDRLASAESKHD
jgi:uncharacterized protein (DUF2236 family)